MDTTGIDLTAAKREAADVDAVAAMEAYLRLDAPLHVVVINCSRGLAECVARQLEAFSAVESVVLPLGGFVRHYDLGQRGVEVSVDHDLDVILSGLVCLQVLVDDSLCGGATVVSRWARRPVERAQGDEVDAAERDYNRAELAALLEGRANAADVKRDRRVEMRTVRDEGSDGHVVV